MPEYLRVWMLMIVGLGWVGCDGRGGRSRSEGSYGPLENVETVPVRAVREARPAEAPGEAMLSVWQTELSPSTLWRSRASEVVCFANLSASGLGGATFLAYSSPTGITSLKPGQSVVGESLRENWLLVGFPGAKGWDDWDSPWAVFLQQRPEQVTLEEDGVRVQFEGEAGYFTLLPLYGYYKPPQKDREVLKDRGFKEKKLLTWEWPTVVARDPLVRLRYWAGATRHFPVGVGGDFWVDRGRDTLHLRARFQWLEVPDAWGTRPARVAPLPPPMGWVLTRGGAFPADCKPLPMDHELPTPYGPYVGIRDVDEYTLSFSLLESVHALEVPVWPLPEGTSSGVVEAWETVRTVVHKRLTDGPALELGTRSASETMEDAIWLARALPYLDEATREQALAVLRRDLRGRWLLDAAYEEREHPEGSGRRSLMIEGDKASMADRLLPVVWAYAHYAGDPAVVKEHWSLIRRWFTTPAMTTWASLGRQGAEAGGEDVATALAYARLAYLAGDLDAYHFGCLVYARERTLDEMRQRGATWFREQQPWHSMEPLDETVRLTHVEGGLVGWKLAEAEAETVNLSPTGLTPVEVGGSSWPEAMIQAWATLRSQGPHRSERLIPGAPASPPTMGLTRSVAGPNPHLLQHVDVGADEGEDAPRWPRVEWGGEWRTPTGDRWNFGEVRNGGGGMEAAALTQPTATAVTWNTVRWDWPGAAKPSR
jgi:hypothetical protein